MGTFPLSKLVEMICNQEYDFKNYFREFVQRHRPVHHSTEARPGQPPGLRRAALLPGSPGVILSVDEPALPPLLKLVADHVVASTLIQHLSDAHRLRLDNLLKRRDNGKTTWLAWLRQSPTKPNSQHMLEHIERLKAWQALDLPSSIERLTHQNRLLKRSPAKVVG